MTKTNDKLGFWATLGLTTVIAPFLYVLFLPLIILRGFIITKLWAWFVVPTFPSAPHLGIVAAIGIAALVSFLTYEYTKGIERETGDYVALFLLYPLTLAFGYVLHLFM